MPQAPLPAPAARLVPQNLIQPMHAGTSTPLDVIAHQQMVDYIGSLQKGVETAQTAMKSKQVAAQAQAQAELAKATSQQVSMYNNYVKMTNARTDIDANTKQAYIDVYGALHGFTYGPGGGSYTPGAGAGPIIAEIQKRVLSGQGDTGDLTKAITGLYPPLPKAPVANTPNTPPPPAPIQKTTTNGTTNGSGGTNNDSGVTVFGGQLGQ